MSLRGVKMLMVLATVAVCITGCPPVAVVSVTPLEATLQVGQSLPLNASSKNAADAPFTWTNSNPAVATIDATTGLSVTVKAVAPGATTITVTGADGGGTATATISVPTPVVEPGPEEGKQVTVYPSSAILETGKSLGLSASSTDPADTLNWTSSDAAVLGLSAATGTAVTANALATGVSVVTVRGSSSGATATATISVLTPGGQIGVTPLIPAGFKVTITGVEIPADLRPLVTFKATNDRGDVIPQVEFSEVRFIIAHLDESPADGNSAQYISYSAKTVASATDPNVKATQAVYDAAGAAGLTQNGDGTYTYRFQAALPADYSRTATHAVGSQLARLSALDGLTYPSNNAVFEWRPDGNPVAVTRDITATEKCNNCHTRLGLHGGNRTEVKLCILCHNPGTVDPDTGNTVDMKVFIHKIHMGKNLPSVAAGTPYEIIGYRGAVNDYSTVVLPQDIRACDICHVAGPQNKAANTQADYFDKPSRAACGSCHDRIWFGDPTATPAGYSNHPLDFAQDNDGMCAGCHTATAPGMAPIDEFHVPVQELAENPGLDLQLTNVSVNPADGTLTIDFLAKHGDGTPITDITPIARAGAIVAWPASEYTTYSNETINRVAGNPTGTLVNTTSDTGAYQYIFKKKLPLDAAGVTFAVAMTGRVDFLDAEGTTEEQGLKDNGIRFFTVDGGTPVPHRAVVDDALCAKCHGETIRGHGGSRLGVEVCEMCHNSTLGRFNLKDMLHKWHTGAELSRDFDPDNEELSATVKAVRFPGLRQQCSICHGKNNVGLPMAPDALPTVITNGDASTTTILPERAACTSCHDSLIDDIHAVANTDAARGVETCAVCHGAGKPEAVAAVHKLTP